MSRCCYTPVSFIPDRGDRPSAVRVHASEALLVQLGLRRHKKMLLFSLSLCMLPSLPSTIAVAESATVKDWWMVRGEVNAILIIDRFITKCRKSIGLAGDYSWHQNFVGNVINMCRQIDTNNSTKYVASSGGVDVADDCTGLYANQTAMLSQESHPRKLVADV